MIFLPILVLAFTTTIALAAFVDYKGATSGNIQVGQIGNFTTTVNTTVKLYPGANIDNGMNIFVTNATTNSIPIKVSSLALTNITVKYSWNTGYLTMNENVIKLNLMNRKETAFINGAGDGWYLSGGIYTQYVSNLATGWTCAFTGVKPSFSYSKSLALSASTPQIYLNVSVIDPPAAGVKDVFGNAVATNYLLNNSTNIAFSFSVIVTE